MRSQVVGPAAGEMQAIEARQRAAVAFGEPHMFRLRGAQLVRIEDGDGKNDAVRREVGRRISHSIADALRILATASAASPISAVSFGGCRNGNRTSFELMGSRCWEV